MEATIQYIEKELKGLYPEQEVKTFVRLILEHVCGFSYTQQVLLRKQNLNDRYKKTVSEITERLKAYEPVQYVLGETEFFGLKLRVTPSVLIPRPETEELVQWVCETKLPEKTAILDIGTGSGCIALALKRQLQQEQVSAVDVSAKALEIARKNAVLNDLEINFIHCDILNWKKFQWNKYDAIVSNPPYVRESEKAAMFPNVLKYEPEGALFVSDTDPLLFYREIADFAQIGLNEKGWLFFEINEKLGNETVHLLKQKKFQFIEIKKDLFGKDRMVRCRK